MRLGHFARNSFALQNLAAKVVCRLPAAIVHNLEKLSAIRQRVKTLTPRLVCHRDLRDTIVQLNPVLRGWGAYFRTGNAAIESGMPT